MNSKKKLVFGLAVGAAAFAGVFAMAATLNVGSSTLGAGNAAVDSCDDAVGHTYSTEFSSVISAYEVTEVTVTGIAAACEGEEIKATLLDGSGASIVEVTDTVALGAGTTHSLSVSSGVAAEDVEDIAVVISE